MKKFISLLCAALILSAIAGCEGQTPPAATVPETTVPETTAPETQPVFDLPEQTRKYQNVRLRFATPLEETAPEAGALTQAAEVFYVQTGAEIEFVWQNRAEGDVVTVAGADLATVNAMDLTELAAAAGYNAHSYACLRQQVTDRCGYLAGIPQTPYLGGIYYNREIFSVCGVEMPKTWEEFLDICKVLQENGYQVLALNSEDASVALELHLEAALGRLGLEDLVATGAWAEQETVIQQIIDFRKTGFLAKGSPAAYPAAQNKLGLSNAAMVVGTNGICGEIEETALADLDWGVFPWPGDAGTGTFVDADVLAVSKTCEDPQAAFDFIMLLTTGEFDQLWADVTGGIPADPANRSVIAGAVEALLAADSHSLGALNEERADLYLGLWDGSFKSAKAFADSWGVG